jgi:hypothetical protein
VHLTAAPGLTAGPGDLLVIVEPDPDEGADR